MKKFALSLLFLVLTFSGGKIISAEELFLVNANEGSTQIDLNWSDIGSSYEVFLDDEPIWKGKENTYTVKNLSQDTYYTLKVVVYDSNNEVKDVIQKRTSTLKETANKENLRLSTASSHDTISKFVKENARIDSTVGNNFVKVEWPEVSDTDGHYDVYRDGQLIATTPENFYIDTRIDPDKIYNSTFAPRKI